jgi:hypothetical protein
MTPAPRRWSAWLASTIAVLRSWPSIRCGLGAGAASARASAAATPRRARHRGRRRGGLTLGERDATLLSNNATGSPFLLFSSDTRLASSGFVEGRIGYRVSPRLTVEGLLTSRAPN